MENYWLAKMKLLRHSPCGSWQGSQQVRTPTFKHGQRHGSHVDTAELWHSRAAFISGYPVMLFTHCFSNKFSSLPNKITQYSKRSKRFKLRCWGKKISIKRRSLKDDFFSCCAWKQLGGMLQLECQNEQSNFSSFETCYLTQGCMKGKLTAL